MDKLKKALYRIFIEGLGGMALGLFSTLIVGTIIAQIGAFIGGTIGGDIVLIGKMAQAVTGAGIGIGVAYKLKQAPLVSFSAAAAGMVICNAGIPHGDDPSRARDLRSYCCAVTNVSLKGLPENWLIDRSVSPVLSCGAFSDKIRAVMELIYMLSLDPDTLGDVCNSLSISLILLVYQLIQSRERRAAKPERQTADMATIAWGGVFRRSFPSKAIFPPFAFKSPVMV